MYFAVQLVDRGFYSFNHLTELPVNVSQLWVFQCNKLVNIIMWYSFKKISMFVFLILQCKGAVTWKQKLNE